MFFKGYIPTKGKTALMSYANKTAEELLTLNEVVKCDSYAGVLNTDSILVDLDDEESADILLDMIEDLDVKCRVYKTSRGMHFLFKNTTVNKAYTHVNLACGLIADIKVGKTNGIEILKCNGVVREVVYDIFEGEEYDPIPYWMLPVKCDINFMKLSDGDGRNQSLFNYILTLQSHSFTKEECRDVLTLMNKYVLAEPLSDRELKVIMRDDAFKKETFYKDRTFLFDKFATFIMNNAYIRKVNNSLHIYKDGIYINGYNYIEQEMIKRIPNLKAKDRTEVLKYLELIVKPVKMADARYIAFNNGIYDIVTDEMLDFSPEYVITNKIPHDYNANAYNELANTTLNKLACGEADTRQLLEEAIGFAFYRRNEMRKSFMLVGDKKNGKSTYLELINNVLGEDNVANLDINEIGDKFLTAEVNGMLANIGDDIEDKYSGHTGFLKKLISGSKVQAQKKSKDPFKLKPYAKFYFSANEIPRFKDNTGALLDRFIIIPFNATFSKDDADFDPFIKYKLENEEVMEYLIVLGIKALKRILATNEFTMTEAVKKELKEFDIRNNPTNLFFEETDIVSIVNHTTTDIYTKYDYWCRTNGFKACSINTFGKKICSYFDLTTKVTSFEGKTVRIYIKK